MAGFFFIEPQVLEQAFEPGHLDIVDQVFVADRLENALRREVGHLADGSAHVVVHLETDLVFERIEGSQAFCVGAVAPFGAGLVEPGLVGDEVVAHGGEEHIAWIADDMNPACAAVGFAGGEVGDRGMEVNDDGGEIGRRLGDGSLFFEVVEFVGAHFPAELVGVEVDEGEVVGFGDSAEGGEHPDGAGLVVRGDEDVRTNGWGHRGV